jgi:serine protease inhibitor
MVYNGASGETASAMADAMRFNGITAGELNTAYQEWRNQMLQPASQIQIDIANSLWARSGTAFLAEFLNLNRNFYGAEVNDLDFSDPASLSRINSWVEQKTRGKIPRIIDRIDSDSVLFLINAIYFKGKWTHQFDSKQTKADTFTNVSGSTSQHPMMRQSGNFQYFEGNDLQSVILPYGDGSVAMHIFLPAKETSLVAFQKQLSAENWEAWMSQYEQAEGDVIMPRFRVEYETELNNALKAQGMGIAFDQNRADFSRMLQNMRGNAFISKVKHKAYVDVNEEGTEAAAATSSEIALTSMALPAKRFHLVVDHPFFFAIRDTRTGAILFLGAVNTL